MNSTTVASAVRLSARVQQLKPSATLAVLARTRELCADGVDVIGFGAGEPDFATPMPIREAAVTALMAGDTHYAPVPGQPRARQAIADKLTRENNITCDATDIVITTGAKQAIYESLQCIIDPGDEVILPTPCWVSYAPMAELAGGRTVEVPGSIDNDFKISPEQLADAITDNTRAIVLNSPSNPCGTMYCEDELRAIAAIIEQHPQIVVISDEIYEKLIYTDTQHFSIGSVEAIADRVITINGLSKAYAMTGWRIGYACAPSGMAAAISKLQSQLTSGITSFNNAAIVEALGGDGSDVERMRQVFASRGTLVYDRFCDMPHVKAVRPTGAFYLFPDVSACFGKTSPGGRLVHSSVALAEALLDEAHVAVVPGDDFGECAKANIRLSFATSDEQITIGCDRIRDWLIKLA